MLSTAVPHTEAMPMVYDMLAGGGIQSVPAWAASCAMAAVLQRWARAIQPWHEKSGVSYLTRDSWRYCGLLTGGHQEGVKCGTPLAQWQLCSGSGEDQYSPGPRGQPGDRHRGTGAAAACEQHGDAPIGAS